MDVYAYPNGSDYEGLVLEALHNLLEALCEVPGEGDALLLMPDPNLH